MNIDVTVVKEHRRTPIQDDGSYLIPEWLIAVIVISLASFLFIVIFGITVVSKRERSYTRLRRKSACASVSDHLNFC